MRTWTNEQLAILDSEYPTANLKELAGRLDKTPEAVKAKALIRKLKRSPGLHLLRHPYGISSTKNNVLFCRVRPATLAKLWLYNFYPMSLQPLYYLLPSKWNTN